MHQVDPSVPVVVLGVHHGTLGIARSLGRLGIAVSCVDGDRSHPALASRYLRRVVAWDMKRAPEAATVAFLEELAHRLGGRPLLIPTTDATTLFVAQHAAPLAASFRFPRRSCELVRSFSDKGEAFRLARRLGIATPAAAFPRSSDDVREFAARATFPLMLKGIDGTRLQRRMGRKMVIVRSERELAAEYTRLEEPGAHNLMLQEYIPGGDDTVWMFNGYFNTDSDCLVAFTGKKLRQHAVHVGATSLGICLPNQAIAELTTSFMKRVGYCGILDIGYRYDARDGVYKLLDPNPRIGCTFRLFVAQNGMDVARCLYLDLTGQPVPAAVPRWGRKWIVEDWDVESCLDYRREGSLTLRQWAASLRGIEEWAWFAADDLGPFFRMAGALGWRLLRWAARRSWSRLREEVWDGPQRWWRQMVHAKSETA